MGDMHHIGRSPEVESSMVAESTGELYDMPRVRLISETKAARSAVATRGETTVGNMCLGVGTGDPNMIADRAVVPGTGGPALLGS